MITINSLQDKLELKILNRDVEYNIALLNDVSLEFKEENKLDDVIVYEDKFYDVKIKIYKEWDSMHIIIGNDEVKCIKNYYNETEVEVKGENIFKCLYGWNNIVIVLKKGEDTEIYKSNYLTVATSKVSEKFINEMIEDIYNFDSELLEDIFANNNMVDKCKNKNTNLKTFVQYAEKVYNFFSENYHTFRTRTKSRIIKEKEVVNIHKAYRADTSSFQWILRNPESLQKVKQETGIIYGGQNYMPQKILSDEKKISFDCYENEVILGFLDKIRNDIFDIYIRIDFKREKGILPKKYKIQQGYLVISDVLEMLLEERNKEFKEHILFVKRNLDKLYNTYKKLFKCKKVNIQIKPKFTDTFRSIKHYRESFVLINEFLEYNQLDFIGYAYIYMLVTLDNIYEYYCLIKLIDVYKKLGYIIVSNNNIYGEDVEKLFTLAKGQEEISIFYQPKIISDKNSKMPLNRRSHGTYKPDYIVRYRNNNREVFSIYDAKFSLVENVKEYYIKNLCYKYIIDTYKIGQRNVPIINLAAFSINGRTGKKYWCIDKYNRDIIPKIDIIVLSSYNNNEDILEYFNNINILAKDICSSDGNMSSGTYSN